MVKMIKHKKLGVADFKSGRGQLIFKSIFGGLRRSILSRQCIQQKTQSEPKVNLTK